MKPNMRLVNQILLFQTGYMRDEDRMLKEKCLSLKRMLVASLNTVKN